MDWSSISSTIGAAFAVLLFLQSHQANALLPPEFTSAVRRWLRRFFTIFNNYIYFTLDEYDGANPNELYTAVQLHLSDSSAAAARSAKLTLPKNASKPTCTIANRERIVDDFEGTKIWWEFSTVERSNSNLSFSWRSVPDEKRSLRMCIHKSDRDTVMNSYIPHLRSRLQLLRLERRERFLYTNLNNKDDFESRWYGKVWTSVPFKHPSTFDTLALRSTLKNTIKEDLKQFANANEFYHGVGRAWKRGYLLFGPPGTGKSSMIAAMANLLEYDVYDLELTQVKSNSELRNLLVKTTNRSIIVIEDIDCSLDLTNERQKKQKKRSSNAKSRDGPSPPDSRDESEKSNVTLSGLLNFVDGLWSCCGDERIFVFTTNHVDKIDKALLRPGRMDMHIELSYCCFDAFKVLAKNYLGIVEHDKFEDVRVAFEEKDAAITPAEVSEVLTRERKDIDKALECLVKEIKESKFKRQAEREEEEKKKKEREKEEEEEAKEKKERDEEKEKKNKKSKDDSDSEDDGKKEKKKKKYNKSKEDNSEEEDDDDDVESNKKSKKKKNKDESEEDEDEVNKKKSKKAKKKKNKDDSESEDDGEDEKKSKKAKNNKREDETEEDEEDEKKNKKANKIKNVTIEDGNHKKENKEEEQEEKKIKKITKDESHGKEIYSNGGHKEKEEVKAKDNGNNVQENEES